jgi:drug/metabolite transporter (DMT)-like permease
MSARTLRVATALASIYLIWGSTYLAIRFAIETVPPLLMAGIRFLVAGAVLYGWVALCGEAARPTAQHWRWAAVIAGLMLLVANGGVCVAELTVPSGLAALLIATVPIWIVLFDWLRPGGSPPRPLVGLGILIGFVGAALLVAPGAGGAAVPAAGAAILMVSCISWAAGSLLSRHAPHPASTLQTTAMQMLCGGALLTLGAGARGEFAGLHPAGASARSILALAYLIVFGSLVAFTAYVWLLRESTPALAATYAYVNPVVAVLLGWLLAGEAVTPRTALAGLVIIAGVALIIAARSHGATSPKGASR